MIRRDVKKEYKQEKKQYKKEFKAKVKEYKKEYKKNKNVLKEQYLDKQDELFKDYIPKLNDAVPFDLSKEAPYRKVLEEIGNAVTHGIGSLFSIFAFIMMLIKSSNSAMYLSAVIYFVGLFMMFTMSCLYHSFPYASKVKHVFRRFDYCSIYLLIGATYAPILLLFIGGTYGLVFLIVQWIIIITGITFVSVFGPGKLRWIHIPLYVLLGWSAVLFLPRMIRDNFSLFIYILIGGVIYTLGIIPFSLNKKVSHFLWHIFVMGGAIVQWIGIFIYLF